MGRSLRRALLGPAVLLVACSVLAACGSSSSSSSSSGGSSGSTGAGGLKKGLKVYVIPKNLGNPYFTTSDSVKSGGALAALQALGETGTETSGTAATPAGPPGAGCPRWRWCCSCWLRSRSAPGCTASTATHRTGRS